MSQSGPVDRLDAPQTRSAGPWPWLLAVVLALLIGVVAVGLLNPTLLTPLLPGVSRWTAPVAGPARDTAREEAALRDEIRDLEDRLIKVCGVCPPTGPATTPAPTTRPPAVQPPPASTRPAPPTPAPTPTPTPPRMPTAPVPTPPPSVQPSPPAPAPAPALPPAPTPVLPPTPNTLPTPSPPVPAPSALPSPNPAGPATTPDRAPVPAPNPPADPSPAPGQEQRAPLAAADTPALPGIEEVDRRREQHGGQQGEVTVSLAWSNRNDLDLHVRCPNGEEIYFDHRSACGGTLDIDLNADDQAPSDKPVENVFWPQGAAPKGVYKVSVDLYAVKSRPATTPFVVIVRMGDDRRVFSGAVHEKEQVEVCSFEMK